VNCRHCGAAVTLPFVDLGSAPPSNAYLTREGLRSPEKWYPLRVLTCGRCWLVQTEDFTHHAELFSDDYAYFSSYSTTWVTHAERYVDMIVRRLSLDGSSKVVEVACNDGYLLQHVVARGIPSLGIEPTKSTATAARAKGVEVVEEFFGCHLADRLLASGISADLAVANNVLAHVPNINDFVSGFGRLLKPAGVATFEFPHLLKTVRDSQFDTVYHEHFSYLSLSTVMDIFKRNGLSVFDVEELPTHGGSIRVYAQRQDAPSRPVTEEVRRICTAELEAGMHTPEFYEGFQARADRVKNEFLSVLLDARRAGRKVAAYGAAAKGSTLMNYAGVRQDLLQFVVDRNPAKQGSFMPGSRIPIVDESRLHAEKPGLVVIFPWNIKAEVVAQLNYVRAWGGQFVTAIPRVEILS
jgi:SAM-dependent methyltransferase